MHFLKSFVGVCLIVAGAFAACAPERTYHPNPEGASGQAGAPDEMGASGATGTSGACSVPQTRCNGLSPERCSDTGQWVASQANCAVACLNGECVACKEGDTTCKDGAVQKCKNGAFVADQVCAKVCENNACVDACTEGGFQCNGAHSLQKCTAGEFVDDTACEFLCSNAECTGVCKPDSSRCNPSAANESQVCDAKGNWGESVPCPADTFCVNGGCKTCKPGTTRCSDSLPQLCSDDGEWVNQPACTGANAVCSNGKCVLCTPGDKRCNDQSVEQCSDDGSEWKLVEKCEGDTPACLASSKTCGKCSKGDLQCADDKVQTCDDTGAFVASETCSGATPQCVNGKCTECDPAVSERRCASATSTQACGSTGSWAAATDCTGDKPQCRDDLGSNCGCDEGARRCRNTTVPELCQGGAWVAQTACSGTLDYCLPSTGACVDCSPGTAQCFAGIAYLCNKDGAFDSLNACSGPGVNCGNCNVGEPCSQAADCKNGICVGGKCAVCNPGDKGCVGTTPRVCGTDGNWTNSSSCTGNTPQCLSSTGQCVACLTGATRTCGSCDTGMQTCTNNQWGTCTGAVDLNTSKQYCGNCTTSCTSGQVCEGGSCLVDCGTKTRCGTSCVDLSTDTSNCLSCGTKCSAPASNGKAICTSSGCDISCNNTRCGTSCCNATPSGSNAGCSGNTCTFTCNSTNHGCNTTSPPCYANTDASHCGSSCLVCSNYVGTSGTCSSNQCACEGNTALACGASTPTCGSWDFNSGTVENWRYGDYRDPSDHHWVGSLGTTVTNGSPALSAQYDGLAAGYGAIEFEVDLCPNSAILNLTSYNVSFDFYFLSSPGVTPFSQDPEDGNYMFFVNGSTVLLACQPFTEPGSDQWIHASCGALSSSMTNFTVIFQLGQPWAGKVFIDNVAFTPK